MFPGIKLYSTPVAIMPAIFHARWLLYDHRALPSFAENGKPQESPLGALLPMLASSIALLVDKHGSTMLVSLEIWPMASVLVLFM